MTALRLLIDPPASGTWNMAVDEALLESAAEGIATLRFYQWNEPTLSLGYFQCAADREQHAASRECPLVRRASGGGAIVHDRELTYSIALPLRDVRTAAATALYNACHESLVVTLATFGIEAALHQLTCEVEPPDRGDRQIAQPFLCFARRTCGDIVCRNSKIVGSAQRRRRGAVLQHGSILLSESPRAPELPGIAQLTGVSIGPDNFSQTWSGSLAKRLGAHALPGGLTDLERASAKQSQERFADVAYTQRR